MKTWSKRLRSRAGGIAAPAIARAREAGVAARFWRVLILGLWLVCGALPLFGQPADGALPPCCRADGAHKCAMRLRAGKVPALFAPSGCQAAPEEAAAGARLVALQARPPVVRWREVLTWEVFLLSSGRETAGVAVHRASRAPPRRSI